MFNGISCVFPCFNEERNIISAITTLSEALRREVAEHGRIADYEIIVVNDGSSDRSAELVTAMAADDPHVTLISFETNQGYGASVLRGLASGRFDLIFFSDSDNQFDYTEIRALLPLAERYDVVCGYRKRRQDPLLRKVNAFAWNVAVRLLFGYLARDLNCAFKIFRKSALDRIGVGSLRSRGALVNTELLVRLRLASQSIVELPVTHLPRLEGKQTGANPRVIVLAFAELFQLYRSMERKKKAQS